MVEVKLVVKYSADSNGDIGLRVDNLRLSRLCQSKYTYSCRTAGQGIHVDSLVE